MADALLHPQDRAYSVPQLFGFLAAGGFSSAAGYARRPTCRNAVLCVDTPSAFADTVPGGTTYAAVELFRGSMVRHSAVAYRNDRPNRDSIEFAGEAWLGYVPIRLPGTICVQERLPPGAAAVLINRSHTYTDIYLPINAQQKKMFDAIDGERTIGEIVVEAASAISRVSCSSGSGGTTRSFSIPRGEIAGR